jgi:tetratricopeptide (TPR) repeat protein
MRAWRRAAWAGALALLLCAPATGLAQVETPAGQVARSDAEIVQQAMTLAVPPQGVKGIAPLIPDLRAVLDRAPAAYPKVEVQGGRAVIRTFDATEGVSLSLALRSGRHPSGAKPTSISIEFPVYPAAALLLASYANETGDHAAAIGYLDRGLALQPNEAILTAEKAAALAGLGRYADELDMLDGWFYANVFAPPSQQARLHRARGFALIELKRLEEAEQAYQRSLELAPDHPGAQQQIAYIRHLRAGGARGSAVMTTAGQAAGVE